METGMNHPPQLDINTAIAVLKVESEERHNAVTSQIREIVEISRQTLEEINGLKLNVGILTHHVTKLEADIENQHKHRISQQEIIRDIESGFQDLSGRLAGVESKVGVFEQYTPILDELLANKRDRQERASTIVNSFFSSVGSIGGDVLKWAFLIVLILILGNSGTILKLINNNYQDYQPPYPNQPHPNPSNPP